MRRRMASVATDITSKITLNDGGSMPLFGLGVWRATPGPGGQTEQAVAFALQKGYRMIDTAEMYENEADVGRELKKSGLNREDVFIVTKLSENGYDRCQKIFKESLEKLDVPYIDLYLVHSPKSGKIIETYKAMLELKEQGLIRSVGVSNFGIQHLEGIKSNGLPVPSVNQIELHPWQQKPDIVKYCRDNNIAVMGYAPLVKGQRFDDETLCEISKRNEADVGRELKKSGLNREDVFIVTKLSENGYDRCKKIFKESLEKLDVPYIDLYLVHSPKSGKIIETYKAMLELKEQGLIRSVGVSNFGIQHLEGIKSNGLPVPSVNQIELHPWQQKPDIVKYCRDNNIAVMGYAPLVKGQRFDDETLCEISKRNNKSPAQILIRWSLQHGFITIPKSVHSSRIEENMLVFDWSLNDKDMAILDNSPDKSCKPWNPCDVPWTG
ncbi:glyoxal reductase-like isoform X1 [Mytilus galloprovincialis]|uniref:glyoxal reductase-like isoform X1 n=1 Tax=Mytilus galloprovincialis TaxID=29158 RepID=UPI003F7C9FDE